MNLLFYFPRRALRLIVSAILFAVAFVSPAAAQVRYGSLVGTVTDSAGLSVPGATVKITQAETNLSRESTTTDSGTYLFTNLLPGTYQVDVALTGFQPFSSRNVTVQQNAEVRVDARLNVGTIQEAIVVSGAAALIQTESAAVQSVTTSQQIETLPTSGRAFQSYLNLMAGVAQPDYGPSAGGVNNPSRAMSVSVNGAPANNTVFRFDGLTATNQWYQELQSYSPGADAIETVNVVSNSFDADSGMAGGAVVNVQLKSGTNTVKGTAFENLTDARLRGKSYFQTSANTTDDQSKHVFGATIGGPIARNKLFYFVSDETTLDHIFGAVIPGQLASQSPGLKSIPTPDIRRGDFSNTGTVLYDPLTGDDQGRGRVPFAFANCGLTSTSDPRFNSCNFIPTSRFSPIAQRLLAAMPLPTEPGYSNNYFSLGGYDEYTHKIDSKLTWVPNNRVTMNSRLSVLPNGATSTGIFPNPDGSEQNPFSVGRDFKSRLASGGWSATVILAKSLVVDGLFGVNHSHTSVDSVGTDCYGAAFGIPRACQPPSSRDRTTPSMNVSGWVLGSPATVRDYNDQEYSGAVNLGWTKGVHNVKFGGDILRGHINHYETAPPSFTFNGGSTALNGVTSPNRFNAMADFLLGLASSRSVQSDTPLLSTDGLDAERPMTERIWGFGSYVRDQFQLSRKLTASVGLRWEYYPFPTRADRGLEIFDFTTNRLQVCGLAGANATVCDIHVQKDLFTPRVGLAYRPTETSVIRGGVSRNPQNDNVLGRGGLAQTFPALISITDTAPNGFTSVAKLEDGVTPVVSVDLTPGTVSLPRGAGFTTVDQNFKRGTITSFNVTYQRLLPFQLNAQIGYVGNRQRDMIRGQNINYGTIGGGAASQPFNQVGLADGLRTTSNISVQRPLGKVNYDSLQVSVSRRMSGGLSFTTAYTYAKSIDWWAASIPIPEFWYLNKGTSGSSIPHKFTASGVYMVPFGAQHAHLNSGFLGGLAGGWQVNAIFTAQSGQPFDITASASSLNAPGSSQRADQVKDEVTIYGFAPGQPYLDPTAFRAVTDARFGNSGLNFLRGPAYANLDMSLFRTFALSRNATFQIRLEVFNVTNTAHFATPGGLNISNVVFNTDGTVKDNGGFGVITQTFAPGREYDERYARVGVRMTF